MSAPPVRSRRVLVPFGLSPPRATRAKRGVQILGGETMGTTWSVKVSTAAPIGDLRRGVETVLEAIIAQMSQWETDSDISRFNAAPAGSSHSLAPEFATVLAYALTLAQETRGAYDPTVGPLVNLWGFGPQRDRGGVPAEDVIAAARRRCGWERIGFDASERRAVQPGGVHLDLSSIAKGYAVDCVAALLKRAGVADFLVEIGGELRGEGLKPDGMPWWVALERPPGPAARGGAADAETIIALHGLSVATSGGYLRCFESGGHTYSHTIDPRTGRPVQHGLVSVTVLHRECMCADALATTLMVLGPEAGLAYAERESLAALFVMARAEGLQELMTPAFAAMRD